MAWIIIRSGKARCVGRPGKGGDIMAGILISRSTGRREVEGDPGEQDGPQLLQRFLSERKW